MPAPKSPTVHSMKRRAVFCNYTAPGIYHVTITVADGLGPILGRVVGDLSQPDGTPGAPRVELTAVGQIVEQELTQTMPHHYPMVEVQDHVVMPDHLHAIIEVHGTLVGASGRPTHLGQVIAGFKYGSNRRWWQWQDTQLGMQPGMQQAKQPGMQQAKPAATNTAAAAALAGAAAPAALAGVSAERFGRSEHASTLRPPLWAPGYCDVMPLRAGQLATQRAYIRTNPRSRLLRMSNRAWLTAQRAAVGTRLTPSALRGYLSRECSDDDVSPLRLDPVMARLLVGSDGFICCDSYGDRSLLERRLLPVVCHRKDKALRATQLRRCFDEAEKDAVLVSARIAPDEQAIVDAALEAGYPVVRVMPDGMADHYHPSEVLTTLCAAGQLLLVTPWRYQHKPESEPITARECKTMNCVAQALCRLKDDWWKS
ncbi:MAG: hypothetical protein IJ528_08080 [Bacteroidaceae bacterium]|nr:hypothetical protein [Bacteroidaceae bacterium]